MNKLGKNYGIKGIVRKNVNLTQAIRSIRKKVLGISNPKVLGEVSSLNRDYTDNLAVALREYRDSAIQSSEIIKSIEKERSRLLKDHSPLYKGDLGLVNKFDMSVSVSRACLASKMPRQAAFLYHLCKNLNSETVVELGTNVGISSAYISVALKEKSDTATIHTVDISPYRQRLARELHNKHEIDNVQYYLGSFYDMLPSLLEKIDLVDIAFIDGHHQYQPTLDYLDLFIDHAKPDTALIFDDIKYSEGMRKAWSEIKQDSRLNVVLDLDYLGVCFPGSPGKEEKFISNRYYL